MKYDITKHASPKMPELGKGTKCLKLLLSQTSKDIFEPLVSMFFPILGAHMSGAEFLYPDKSWKEPTGMMANLVAESGGNKVQLSNLVETICRNFHRHSFGIPSAFLRDGYERKASKRLISTAHRPKDRRPKSEDIKNQKHYALSIKN